MEQNVLISVGNSRRAAVVALGGGVMVGSDNRRLLVERGVSVYLSCSQRVLYSRLKGLSDRPLLHKRGMTDAQALREIAQDVM